MAISRFHSPKHRTQISSLSKCIPDTLKRQW